MKKLLIMLLTVLLLLSATAGQAGETYQKWETNFFGTFDTLTKIIGYSETEAQFSRIAAEAYTQFQWLHSVYDAYQEYEGVNNLYVLNRDGGKGPVHVEPELMELLLFCREMQPKAQDTVNIALGTVLKLWHEYREAGQYDPSTAQLPPEDALLEAAQHTNFDDVIIDEAAGTVYFADPQLQLDVGAVAKGFATEKVGRWMLQSDMPSFLISAGGNVFAGDPPLDGRLRWGVSIQDPDGNTFSDANSEYLDILFLSNASVVTSGDYERGYVVDGKRYHHIISPWTLMPPEYYRSVTVVCEDSGWADMLSTALFVLPYEESRALADSLDSVEAYWMLNDGERTIEMTDGIRAMAYSLGATAR